MHIVKAFLVFIAILVVIQVFMYILNPEYTSNHFEKMDRSCTLEGMPGWQGALPILGIAIIILRATGKWDNEDLLIFIGVVTVCVLFVKIGHKII